MKNRTSCLMLSLAMGATLAIAEEATLKGQATIVDGDTIEIHGRHIRLWGIDAIEGAQRCWDEFGEVKRCGKEASFALADVIGRHTVTCRQNGWDGKNSRPVAICEANGIELNDWMVRHGFAVDYVKYSGGAYSAAENEARANEAGNWRYSWQYPENFRACMRIKGAKALKCSQQ